MTLQQEHWLLMITGAIFAAITGFLSVAYLLMSLWFPAIIHGMFCVLTVANLIEIEEQL